MNNHIKIAFLVLVLLQGLHSIEEYYGKLWKVFKPAKIISGMVSDNLEKGFLIINIGLFILGIFLWAIPVRMNYSITRKIIWFWILIEMINGFGHPIWAFYERSYVPGVITAPVLLVISFYLFWELSKS